MSTERTALYELITEDTVLNELGVTADNVFNSNDVDSPTMRPFVAIRWRNSERAFNSAYRRYVTIWVHDTPSDYTVIDSIIKRLNALLGGAVHVEGTDGSRITMFDHQGDSDDLIDDGFGTIARNTTWQALPH